MSSFTLQCSRALTVGILLLAAAGAMIAGDPVYVKRLNLPVAGDQFGYARAVTTDLETGEVLVCDSRKNRILIFDEEGLFRYEVTGGQTFSSPVDLAVDRDGFLFLLANYRRRRAIIELDFDGFFRREITLTGLPEEVEPPSLQSLAISPEGDRLYLLDQGNLSLWITDRDGRVLKRTHLGGELTEKQRLELILGTVNVYGDRVLLAVPFRGEILFFDLDGEPAGRAGKKGTGPCQLGFPTAAAMDSEENLVIIDQQRMVIVRWDPRENRCLGEYYGRGNAPGYFYYPVDLALSASGRAYVPQGFDNRVQVYEGLDPAARIVPPAVGNAVQPPEIAVEAAVHAWAEAMSEQRVEDYLSAYSRDYLPWGVEDREVWDWLRRAKLDRASWVEVDIADLQVELVGDFSARATFVEDFRTSNYELRVRKTLVLIQEHGAWKIIEEHGAAIAGH